MASSIDPSALLFPEWLFEQDYLVFFSMFGWMLLGLLAWTKPLCDRQNGETHWKWVGFFAFFEAMADFVRTLSFSDPFFRTFSIETPLEMLALGFLVEISLRRLERYKNRVFPPFAACGCGLLGFAIEVGPMIYSLIVAFLVSTIACVWFAATLGKIARETRRHELYWVLAGILLLIPAWILHPDHLAYVQNETLITFNEYPFYGFRLLFLRILSAWLILSGFWYYRLQARIEDVGPPTQERLRFWGYRVLPGIIGVIVLASYLVTTWNGRRERESLEMSYLSRSQTAVLAIGEETARKSLAGDASEGSVERRRALESLKSIRSIGTDVMRVYLWKEDDGNAKILFDESGEQEGFIVDATYSHIKRNALLKSLDSFTFGPTRLGPNLALHVSSPILDTQEGRTLGWLGIDLAVTNWMRSISLARLQTIIIAGLVLAQVIFFLYYQIENESETDLALAKERAEAADRAKSEFLAVISHEIRTPLQSVLGYSNLLRGTRLDEKQMACLDTIQSEGKILLRIVQDILDFSNLRKASSELKEGNVSVKRLINETYRTIRPMAEKKGLVAELKLDEGLPIAIRADGVRLRQILLNLFGNSVKYTDRGTISLAVKKRGGDDQPGSVDFVISDTGVGIHQEDLGRLFEPFIQLEHVGASPREGAGLGLAIVKRIVELMGGSISVESEFGKGSTFTVSFDFDVLEGEEEEAFDSTLFETSHSNQTALLGETFPLKVLVADDNPMVRRLIVQYLESLGYEPDEVDDGLPASENGGAYDLVVTDLRMPGMDGPTAASIIREKSGLADQPWIVGVSASLEESEIERAIQSGVNDFLGKPFFVDDLEQRIKAIPWLEELSQISEEEGQSESKFDDFPIPNESSRSTAFAAKGMGVFPEEVVLAASSEVNALCEDMERALEGGRFQFVSEKAHYISNTAMAIGIEQLYVDSKSLQASADQKGEECWELLKRLQVNFKGWQQSRRSGVDAD